MSTIVPPVGPFVPVTAGAEAAPQPEQPAEALAELHTRLLDTIQGFDTMVEKAEPEFRPIAAEFRALHTRQSAAVARMLVALNHDPDSDGSFFGTVNSAVVTVRSWFDEISTNVMDAVVQGEKHVLEAYDQAIEQDLNPERQRVLQDDRRALIEMLDRYAGDINEPAP